MAIPEAHRARADAVAKKIIDDLSRYQKVWLQTGVPWYWVAPIHYREADLSWHGHLANGDPLTHRTVHVPAGRIPHKPPPYTWEEAAADALECRHLHHIKTWDVAQFAYQAEGYNGWGYRHHHINSPYLWSGCNHYSRGKFVRDGVFDRHRADEQLGVMVILRRLMVLDPTVVFPAASSYEGPTLPPPTVALPRPSAEPADASNQAEGVAPQESLLHKLLRRAEDLIHDA
jgi:lysozyme family protein